MKASKIVFLVLSFCLLFMTIGFARYNQTLQLNGNVSIGKVGRIEITRAVVVETNKATATDPTYDGINLSFSVRGTAKNYSATYEIDVVNNSDYEFVYTDLAFSSSRLDDPSKNVLLTTTIKNKATNTLLHAGESLESGESITLTVKIEFEADTNTSEVGVNGDFVVSQDNTGSLLGTMSPNSGDLRGTNTISCGYTATITNSFKYARTFSLKPSNDNIVVTDASGANINSFSIPASSDNQTYPFCMKVKEGSIFLTTSTTTDIIMSSNGVADSSIGTVNFLVDKDEYATDEEPPHIANVNISYVSVDTATENANINISWDRTDTGGTSVQRYYILLTYPNGSTTTYQTANAVTNYSLKVPTQGNYTAKVYGVDEKNSGQSHCSSTSNQYCAISPSTPLRWIFTVTPDFDSNITFNGSTKAYLNTQYVASFSLGSSSNRSLPTSDDLTVSYTDNGNEMVMGGDRDYTYSTENKTGTVIINAPSVTENITIYGRSSIGCLVKGTKILMADKSLKNIEDITYHDLILVYDHDNGGLTPVYPLWIEKEKTTDNYTKISFSDGTILNTFSGHGIYSLDKNKYISTISNDFHVGSNVAKVNDDGSVSKVFVTNIEKINKPTTYYQVSSTRYDNVIANNILTTDGMIAASNMFKYDSNITWTKDRNEFLQQNNLFYYNDYSMIFDRYVWEGFRMSEAKPIYYNKTLNIMEYSNILKELVLPQEKSRNGKNLWMVTTSDDVVSDYKKFLHEEETFYTLPEPNIKNNFKGWLCTSDNKIYNPKDKIEVLYGLHFIALYKWLN